MYRIHLLVTSSQKQSQEKMDVVMGEKEEALRKTEEAHQLAIDEMAASHQQVRIVFFFQAL